METYTLTICKIDGQWKFAVGCRELNPEGWDGVEDGREAQEGGDIYILTADSCCCMAETNATL